MNTTKSSNKWIWIATILFLSLGFFIVLQVQTCSCTRTSKAVESSYKLKIDSLTKSNLEWKNAYEKSSEDYFRSQQQFSSKISSLQASLNYSRKEYQDKLLEVQNYSSGEIIKFFATRYPDTLKTDSAFLLKNNVGRKVILDLVEGDQCAGVQKIQDSIILIQRNYLNLADSSIIQLGTERNFLKTNLAATSADLDKSEALRQQLAADLKRERKWNIGIGVVGGTISAGIVAGLILSLIGK